MKTQYHPTRRGDFVDVYGDVKVDDPYQWLEDPDAEEVKEWVDKQADLTTAYLEQIQARNAITSRLTELYNYERYSVPFRKGEQYFYFKNDGLQNQNVLYIIDTLTSEPRVFLDPNTLSDDGTVSLRTYSLSEDGTLFAYALSESGSDWSTIYVRTVDDDHPMVGIVFTANTDFQSGKLNEKLLWVKFSGISWTHDNKGFFYSRYPEPTSATDTENDKGRATSQLESHTVYYHRVGTEQSEDIAIYNDPDHPNWNFYALVTSDGGTVLIYVSESTDPVSRLYYYSLKDFDPQQSDPLISPVKLIDNFEADYSYIVNYGSLFYFKTNLNAPRYKVIAIDLENPAQENWKEIISEHPQDVLDDVDVGNEDKLVVCYLRDVKDVLEIYDISGSRLSEIELPSVGSVVSLFCRKKSSELFLKFMSFFTPGIILRYDLSKIEEKPTTFRVTEMKGFDSSEFVANQVFYPSKDGTKVPMFLVHKKGLVKDGNNPVWLYGYGGFSISLKSEFSATRLPWLQNINGIFALPNIRAVRLYSLMVRGEYGEQWHKAGQKEKKQTVFDDFQAAAEYLVKENYTRPELIAIQGGSNGGLLVAACANQRPDLFGVVLCQFTVNQVGVLDMLKFHKFTIGHFWKSEYGDPDSSTDFKYIYEYSPVHNINTNQPYPAMLLTTADHDDRVSPLHSYKYIAALQNEVAHKEYQTKPLLIRIERKSGHGAGRPIAKILAESADLIAFMIQNMNLQWHD